MMNSSTHVNINWKDVMMNRDRRLIILAMVGLIGMIIFLSIRNDSSYNNQRQNDVIEAVMQDSLVHKQIDSIMVLLDEIIVKLDSISIIQKEFHVLENQNIDNLKMSLRQLNRIERQMLNYNK